MVDDRDLLASAFRHLPVGVWIGATPDGRRLYSNEAFAAILGPAPERVPFERVVASGRSALVDDMVLSRPDGTQVHLRAFASPIRDFDGTLTAVAVAFLDISSEVNAVREREATEAQLALAVNTAPIVIWAVDAKGNITLSEGAGLSALHVRSGELVGSNVFELYAAHPTISGYIGRALAGETIVYSVEIGDAVFDSTLVPLRNASGELSGAVGLSHDVSEIRRLQAVTIQNDRVIAMGTLAASVAHEINNPLTYMLGHAELLAEQIRQIDLLAAEEGGATASTLRQIAENMREHLQPLQAGAGRIANITRELRGFNRPDDATLGPVDVGQAIRAVLQLVGKDVEAAAHLILRLDDTPPVRGSEARMNQLILNLLLNAMQALASTLDSQHEISVRTTASDGSVLIEVADSGPGVPAQDRERIFEPFVTSKGIGDGTGLGLFVCRNIVRAMGGEISVSDRIGGGARFTVRLPVCDPLAAAAVEPVTAAKAVHSKSARVLVIDDDAMVGNLLCAQLRLAGHKVSLLDDAEQALQLLLQRPASSFDLVYCDLMMRGMTGMDFAQRLAEAAPEILERVIFMTGGAFTPQGSAFLTSHLTACIEKPFDIVAVTAQHMRRAVG